ncbi:MAG: hypothetical protein WDN28_17050 [Chthoniobacter sp.]
MNASIHDEAEFWAATAATGGLTDTESQAWSDHRKVCPACQKLHTEEMTMSTLLQRTLGPESPDPGFEQRLIHRLDQTRIARGNRWYELLLFHPGLVLLAACLAVLAVVGAAMWTAGHKAAGVGVVAQRGKNAEESSAPQIAANNAPSRQEPDPVPALTNHESASPDKVELAMKGSSSTSWPVPDETNTASVALEAPHRHHHHRHPHRHHRHHHHAPREGDAGGALNPKQGATAGSHLPIPNTNRSISLLTSPVSPHEKNPPPCFDGGSHPDGFARWRAGRKRSYTSNRSVRLAPLPSSSSPPPPPSSSPPRESRSVIHPGRRMMAMISKSLWQHRGRLLPAMVGTALLATAYAAPVPLAQVPAAVQQAIKTQLANGILGEIDRDEEDGKVTYTFEVTKAGRSVDYTLDETGALVGVEMTLSETPSAVQKTIQSQIGQGVLQSIDKTIEDGQVTYDVAWRGQGRPGSCVGVLESGQLDSVEVELEETPPAVRAAIAKEAGPGRVGGNFQDLRRAEHLLRRHREGGWQGPRNQYRQRWAKWKAGRPFGLSLPRPCRPLSSRTSGPGKSCVSTRSLRERRAARSMSRR